MTGILSLIRFELGQNWDVKSNFLAGLIKGIILGPPLTLVLKHYQAKKNDQEDSEIKKVG